MALCRPTSSRKARSFPCASNSAGGARTQHQYEREAFFEGRQCSHQRDRKHREEPKAECRGIRPRLPESAGDKRRVQDPIANPERTSYSVHHRRSAIARLIAPNRRRELCGTAERRRKWKKV
jgi:hypothetical protein